MPDLEKLKQPNRPKNPPPEPPAQTITTIARFDADFETFSADTGYFNSISMSIMQVGELSVGLSDEFKRAGPVGRDPRDAEHVRSRICQDGQKNHLANGDD